MEMGSDARREDVEEMPTFRLGTEGTFLCGVCGSTLLAWGVSSEMIRLSCETCGNYREIRVHATNKG